MNPVTVYLVHLPDTAREIAQKAARDNWPRVQFVTADTVAEAAEHVAPSGRQLLALGGPEEAEAGVATQTLDASDLPRWAVVRLGRHTSDLAETVAPEDWNISLLARVFRASLLQHEMLRENLQLRGDLRTIARRVSHDARTPLGCIHTVCELLKDVPPENAESLRESTDIVRNATEELSVLVDRVSFLVRASLDPLPPAVFSMGTAVDAAMQQLQPEIAAAQKKIRQPAEWPEVEGVLTWCEVIWNYLLRNSLVHGGKTGTIQLGWTSEEGGLRCWVSSPGAVPEAHQPRLLRRFHQLHQQTSGGLGLSIVERLVTLQGGTCRYESAADNRAVFSFTLRIRHRGGADSSAATPSLAATPAS